MRVMSLHPLQVALLAIMAVLVLVGLTIGSWNEPEPKLIGRAHAIHYHGTVTVNGKAH
jgi:hypothetical protein